MEVEEFSFPVTTESCRLCIDSPTLWRVPSSTSSSPAASRREEAEASPETSLSEEKMDKLWEEFNEELQFDSGDHCSKDTVKFGCVKPFIVSKCNKSGVVSLLKVLRKMFLIHNKKRQLKKQQHLAAR